MWPEDNVTMKKALFTIVIMCLKIIQSKDVNAPSSQLEMSNNIYYQI